MKTECCGNILTTECSSSLSCLGAAGRRSVANRPGGWETGPSLGMGPVSPHSVNIQLPFEVPRVLFSPGGWSIASSPGMDGIDPSTQHTPTTVTLTMSPLTLGPGIAEDAGVSGWSLAVWPLVSGRMAGCASMSWFEPDLPQVGTVIVPTSGLSAAPGDLGWGASVGYIQCSPTSGPDPCPLVSPPGFS